MEIALRVLVISYTYLAKIYGISKLICVALQITLLENKGIFKRIKFLREILTRRLGIPSLIYLTHCKYARIEKYFRFYFYVS